MFVIGVGFWSICIFLLVNVVRLFFWIIILKKYIWLFLRVFGRSVSIGLEVYVYFRLVCFGR